MKKWIISILVIIIFCGIRFVDPWFLDMVRMKALDQHQRTQQEEISDKIVTVEIDNESIRERGQWPWPRNELAKDIEELYRMGAAIVVVPILFADEDRMGGDQYFDDMLKISPTIIGQIPANQTKGNPVPRGIATIGTPWQPWVYNYEGAVGPIEPFAKSAIGVGMMLVAPEGDGVVRRMPLVVQIDGQLYPSLSMEILRVAAGDLSYQMKTGEGGIEALRIPKYKKILTDANGAVWIDFKWKTKTYALNKLYINELFEELNFNGKIVILSPTASGIDNPVATPVGVIQSHDLIAASITTMMTGRNITRPFWSDLAELSATLVASLILTAAVLTLNWYFGAILLPIFLAGSYYGSSYLFTEYSYLIDWS
jgi:adenylate cyclase